MDKYEFLSKFELLSYKFPTVEEYWDTSEKPFEMRDRPTLTQENFLFLVEKHNELVEFISENLDLK